MNFTVAVIARNEEKTLPRLVESLKEFQEKKGVILVLDTGSSDNTANVARDLGCEVHEVGDRFLKKIDNADEINKLFLDDEEDIVKDGDALFDYSSARNYIASLSKTEMVAMPDCDEVYTKFDLDVIQQKIEAGVDQLEYNFVFSHDQFGNEAIKFLHSKFYNHKKAKWVGIIHEVLQGDVNRQFLDEDIIKLEHWQNPETNRGGYLKGLALDCYENQTNDRNSHYFGRELCWKGRPKSAIKELKRHIGMSKWPQEKGQSMIYIGDSYGDLGDENQQVEWYNKAIECDSSRRESWMRLANLYYKKGDFQRTACYASAALAIPWNGFYGNNRSHYEHEPHELLYWAFWELGDRVKSKEHWQKAIDFIPNNPKYLSDAKFYNDTKYDPSKFTGERYIPGIDRPDMEEEHYARYNFAAKFTEGKVVLDAACGSGFGEDVMKAKEYIGVDISPDVKCTIQDLEKGIDLDIKPDVVVSFETIEHLENPTKFLQWVKENAKQFIFSIPVSMPSEFHKQVYTVEEIKELIGTFFSVVDFYEQNAGEITRESDDPKYIVGVAHIEQLPVVSIVIPTLGREEGLDRCLKSIKELNYPEDKIDIIILDGNTTVPKKVAKGLAQSKGEYVCYAANDTEFTPDSLRNAIETSRKEAFALVAFNTGEVLPDEGNICEHFIIRKDFIEHIDGEIFDTEFHHVGVDNLLWAKCNKMGQAVRDETAVMNHYHFSKGEKMDDVYEKGWKNVDQDRELLKLKLSNI
ncbi:MAG: glycosyltransferase [Candidatus Scalindua sp.]|jgi:glycosyltransferase involved in cell wall biosynthesis|nr:glycosyltransferase [Candidatus Scalindua sp.]MBT6757769.1 glycosyltransferase [Candidatus Jacksonbacteria bacterium]